MICALPMKKTLLAILAAATLAQAGYAGQPHYLKNVPTTYEDDVDQLTAKFMVYNSLTGKYPNRPPKDFVNGAITVTEEVHGKKTEFIFKNYRWEVAHNNHQQKVVAHYTMHGREELTPEEFDDVKKDMVTTLGQASHLAYQRHSQTYSTILTRLEKSFKEDKLLQENEKLEDKLKLVVEPGLTAKDIFNLPDIEQGDFVPHKIIIGPIPALGMAYLNSGWIYYDPKARILDYLDGVPNVLAHECEHRNVKLQRMPYAFAFDAETWASLGLLETNDPLDFLLHPYYADVRDISKRLFGFDSDYAFKKSFFVTEGGIKPNKEHLRKFIAQISVIAKEIQQTAMEEFIPEYYAHFSFWSTVNEKLKDKNAALKLYMYKKYDPTLLGGAETTRRWLEKNKLIIEEASRKALQNVAGLKIEKEQRRTDAFIHELKKAGIHTEHLDPRLLHQIYTQLQSLGYIR